MEVVGPTLSPVLSEMTVGQGSACDFQNILVVTAVQARDPLPYDALEIPKAGAPLDVPPNLPHLTPNISAPCSKIVIDPFKTVTSFNARFWSQTAQVQGQILLYPGSV